MAFKERLSGTQIDYDAIARFGNTLKDFLVGLEENLVNVPALVSERLIGLELAEDVDSTLWVIRERFWALDPDDQRDLGLYLSGVPDEGLTVLLSGDITVLTEQLREVALGAVSDAKDDDSPAEVALPVRRVVPIGQFTAKSTVVHPPYSSDSARHAAAVTAALRDNVVAMPGSPISNQKPDLTTVRIGDQPPIRGDEKGRDLYGNPVYGEDEPLLAWQERALCAQTDPEAFFPEKGGSTKEAKKICSSCDVREECLDYALTNGEKFGIWGGYSERERRKLLKKSGDVNKKREASTSDLATTIEPFYQRPRRIEQFLKFISADEAVIEACFDHPERFARLVRGLLQEIYESEEVEESVAERHERLLKYFITSKKEKELYPLWEALTGDLVDLRDEIAFQKEQYEIDATPSSPLFAQYWLDNWTPEDPTTLTSVHVSKKPVWMHKAGSAEQTATSSVA